MGLLGGVCGVGDGLGQGNGWEGGMAGSHVMMQRLKQLDAYPKINEDFYSRTLSGGIITIVSATFMVLLFFSELRECAGTL